jgi:hypothetical protein
MGREAIRLAEISPADIIADIRAIPDDDYELFDAFPSEMQNLEYNIAEAVTKLLPDELIVREESRTDPEGADVARVWLVLQGLDPATKRVGRGGRLEDDDTASHEAAIAWLATHSRVAEAINLDALVAEAVRHARLVLQADA